MTVLPDLERQLVDAAARVSDPELARPARRMATRVARLAGPALAIAVTLAIALAAVTLLHTRTNAPQPAAPTRARQQLTAILGVLRRPQTRADLDPKMLALVRRHAGPGPLTMLTPDFRLIRLAAVTPWGSKIFFVPLLPPAHSVPLPASPPGLRAMDAAWLHRLAGHETLDVVEVGGPDGGSSCCSTAATIERGGGGTWGGGPRLVEAVTVVPDGVTRVVIRLPRQGSPGARIYPRALIVGATVHGNVAAFLFHRSATDYSPFQYMTWYGAAGQVLRQIGNPRRFNRIVPPPTPAPETPLSRAAERDPSTPNRVWVTPATGGPHTIFRIHFRVLLNGADYAYRFTGTHCPRFTFPGGTGGGTNDFRGALWSDPVSAVQGQALCPGTYRVTVSAMDLGPSRPLHRPERPFGSATFHVTG